MSPRLPESTADLRSKLRELGLLTRRQEAGLPQFLILGSEHSGAREVATFLNRHATCSLPATLGTRFFSSQNRTHGFDWYLRSLGDRLHAVRGEWTPSYAFLPLRTIRLIHELLPSLRLVLILDDPAHGLWHAAKSAVPSGADWRWAPADSLGHVELWSSVFPSRQFLVLFKEQLRQDPHESLKILLQFLDVAPEAAALEEFTVGDPAILAVQLAACRQGSLTRTEELADLLSRRFQRQIPASWLEPPEGVADAHLLATAIGAVSCMAAGLDEVALSRAVEHCDAADLQPLQPVDARDLEFLTMIGDTTPHLVLADYRGYNLVHCHDLYLAVPVNLGDCDLSMQSDPNFKRLVAQQVLLRARSLTELRQTVDAHLSGTVELQLVSIALDGSEVYRVSPNSGLLVGEGFAASPVPYLGIPRCKETAHSGHMARATLRQWWLKGLCVALSPTKEPVAVRA